jgi:HEAT repeat protein
MDAMIKKTSKAMEQVAELGRLARGEMTPEVVKSVRKALDSPSNRLVERAAEIAADNALHELIPALLAAFDRLLEDGTKTDKGCVGKTAIVKVLNTLEHLGGDVFLKGARCIQMEATFGAPEDMAVEVRAHSAFGLARIGHADAHYILAELLMDPWKTVRAAAARAVAYMGESAGELMLRLKVLTGDKEPEVFGECFLGLMAMSPERSLPFVARYLHSHSEGVGEAAAIAIGRSHLPEAFAVLRQAWDGNPFPSFRRTLLVPISLIRSDDAFEFLVKATRTADKQTAADSLSALRLYAGERYTDRVREAVAARDEPVITARFQQEFSDV